MDDQSKGDMPTRSHQVGGRHYLTLAVQPWDAMAAWLPPEQMTGFLRGCVIKYMARGGRKGSEDKYDGGTEDYRKAQHYLARLIELCEAATATEET